MNQLQAIKWRALIEGFRVSDAVFPADDGTDIPCVRVEADNKFSVLVHFVGENLPVIDCDWGWEFARCNGEFFETMCNVVDEDDCLVVDCGDVSHLVNWFNGESWGSIASDVVRQRMARTSIPNTLREYLDNEEYA